ncbi:polysaccharide deacetylase family protein [Salegentibacter chungangensis]|uniref:Polysaccharide deacetylase family protein n=1 Tax=Salegentibacter chungangensis TaxID=1335724 RepID=A0ABW3NNL7_9FLAO
MSRFLAKYPAVLKWLYPNRLSRLNTRKTIYLTFDDGPVPEVTPWVLEQLKKHQAKATFFCIGENIKKHPEVYKAVLAEGHKTANHTYNHFDGWKTGLQDYIKNTQKTEELLKQPEENKLFRPPFGKIKNNQASELVKEGYKIVMWDVISWDFNGKTSAEDCLENVLKHTVEGSIIVFHDSLKAKKNLEVVLPQVLKYYSEKGMNFESL